MLPVLERELVHVASHAFFRPRRMDAREICGMYNNCYADMELMQMV